MNYEQKYKGALEWMRSVYDGLHGATKEDAEHYFPELKESDDERISKEIISFLKDFEKDHYRSVNFNSWIAWLEKQGEQSTIIDIDKMVMEYSQTEDGNFGLPINCMIRAYRKGINDALSIALNIEKQGEKKSVKDAKTIDADKVIKWLKNTIREVKERFGEYGVYYNTQLALSYNSIEDLINDFKENFGL